jgi:ATP-dependent Clp protease ATP-binding subunit ClpC
MGARPLRRAIQRYIEDPLADFVLRSQVPSGSTVMVDAPDGGTDGAPGDEGEVKLTVIEPKEPQPTPVGVGGGDGEEPAEPGSDAPDTPAQAE